MRRLLVSNKFRTGMCRKHFYFSLPLVIKIYEMEEEKQRETRPKTISTTGNWLTCNCSARRRRRRKSKCAHIFCSNWKCWCAVVAMTRFQDRACRICAWFFNGCVCVCASRLQLCVNALRLSYISERFSSVAVRNELATDRVGTSAVYWLFPTPVFLSIFPRSSII